MTLAELKALIDTNIPDNTTGLITPAKERQVMKAISDFVVSSQGESDTAPFVYDPAFSYSTGDPVIYDSAWYLSLVDSNLNNTPDSNPTEWDPVNAFNTVLSIYEVNAVYLGTLTIVINNDKLYLLDRDSVGSGPYVSTDFAAELAAGDWINLLPNSAPVANSYASPPDMIAGQGSQVAGYLYFGGATLYVYLGTTDGDIDDYFALGGGGGGISSVVAGTGIDVNVTDPANPVVGLNSASQTSLSNADTAHGWGNHASAGYLTGFEEATHRENATVLFDKPYISGINGIALSGDIDFSFTGAKLGAWTIMRHADVSAFSFDDNSGNITFVKLFDDTEISTSADNYFLFTLVDKTVDSEIVIIQHQLELS